jgi:hypothetical protein
MGSIHPWNNPVKHKAISGKSFRILNAALPYLNSHLQIHYTIVLM